jgi:hypothetical protein
MRSVHFALVAITAIKSFASAGGSSHAHRKGAHVLDKYDIDLEYETHRGFLDDTVLLPRRKKNDAYQDKGKHKLHKIQQYPLCRTTNGRKPFP